MCDPREEEDSYIVAIDIGTQSTRAALVSATGGTIKDIAQILHNTEEPYDGWAQQQPSQWWDETCRAIRKLLVRTGSNNRILAVACCGQMHGPVGIDKDGQITTPWVQLWCDKRCEPQAAAITSKDKVKRSMMEQKTANPISSAWPGIKVLWEKENRTESYEKTIAYLMPKDFINYKLTGAAATDHSEMSLSYLYDAATQDYSDELADLLGVDIHKFPPIYKSHETIGTVIDEASAQTGMPAGVPVIAGGGDFPVSLLGVGLSGPDYIADCTGTSSLLAAHTNEPVVPESDNLVIQNMRHVTDGWVPFTILDCGGISMKWCRDVVASVSDSTGDVEGSRISYDRLIEMSRDVPAGSQGLIFFPYMLGERRQGNTSSKGGFFGIRLEHKAHHFIRAVMEGVAYSMGKDASTFQESGINVPRILSVGGGAKNELWNKIKASVLNVPVAVALEPEAGIKGCALLAATGIGLIEDLESESIKRRRIGHSVHPNRSDRVVYAERQDEFNRIYNHMLGFWQETPTQRQSASECKDISTLTPTSLAAMIDHTFLKPFGKPDDIEQLCAEARKYGFAMVAVNPAETERSVRLLKGSKVGIGAAIGFPLGASTIAAKDFEVQDAIEKGATEIDMVINIRAVKAGQYETVRREISNMVSRCKPTGVICKVICETCHLEEEELVKVCLIAKEEHADYVKTSTGFGTAGAKIEHVKLMRKIVGPAMGVKASGGIRTLDDTIAMIEAGANRIGTSSGVSIVQELISRQSISP